MLELKHHEQEMQGAFGVVAQEIQALAETTRQSTDAIQKSIQTVTQMAVHLADNAESLLDLARINQQEI